MTAEVRVVQEIDKDTRIVYVKTKGVMFTSCTCLVRFFFFFLVVVVLFSNCN